MKTLLITILMLTFSYAFANTSSTGQGAAAVASHCDTDRNPSTDGRDTPPVDPAATGGSTATAVDSGDGVQSN